MSVHRASFMSSSMYLGLRKNVMTYVLWVDVGLWRSEGSRVIVRIYLFLEHATNPMRHCDLHPDARSKGNKNGQFVSVNDRCVVRLCCSNRKWPFIEYLMWSGGNVCHIGGEDTNVGELHVVGWLVVVVVGWVLLLLLEEEEDAWKRAGEEQDKERELAVFILVKGRRIAISLPGVFKKPCCTDIENAPFPFCSRCKKAVAEIR